MGLDFIRNAAPNFDKGLDRGLVALATPGFFTQIPVSGPRTYHARILDGCEVMQGEEVGIRIQGDEVHVTRGLALIAILNAPPSQLIDALKSCFGEAAGIVEEVLEFARSLEVSVC